MNRSWTYVVMIDYQLLNCKLTAHGLLLMTSFPTREYCRSAKNKRLISADENHSDLP